MMLQALLSNGNNAIGVAVGQWMVPGILAWGNNKDVYGKNVGPFVPVADNLSRMVLTQSLSLIIAGNHQPGHSFMQRYIMVKPMMQEQKRRVGQLPDNDDADGVRCKSTGTYPLNNLLSTYNEPVKKHETFKPVKII